MVVQNGPIQKLPHECPKWRGGGVKATFGQFPKQDAFFLHHEDVHPQLCQLASWFLQPNGNPSLQARGIWCSRELRGFDSSWLVAPGVMPGDFCSSGIVVRKASNSSLKSSITPFPKFLISFGRALRSFAPDT